MTAMESPANPENPRIATAMEPPAIPNEHHVATAMEPPAISEESQSVRALDAPAIPGEHHVATALESPGISEEPQIVRAIEPPTISEESQTATAMEPPAISEEPQIVRAIDPPAIPNQHHVATAMEPPTSSEKFQITTAMEPPAISGEPQTMRATQPPVLSEGPQTATAMEPPASSDEPQIERAVEPPAPSDEHQTATVTEPPSNPGDEDDDMSLFAPVLARLRLDRLPALASSVRRSLDSAVCEKPLTDDSTISCSLQAPPLYGSYNVLFPLRFEDGLRWVLKVPATAHPGRWDEQAARSLKAEAQTMRLLNCSTTIAVPKMFSFEPSMDNELNCAFILMEYIDGVPLQDVWFDKQISSELLESRRLQSLQDVAKMMVQLDQFSFTQSGSPIFDQDGSRVIDFGPAIMPDTSAMLDRLGTDDEDETAIFSDIGPFEDARSSFLAMLNRRDPPPDKLNQGFYKLLRLFIDWLDPVYAPRSPSESERLPFVLTHPDLDIQNVLVSQDGQLRALIDWDGVRTVPRCLGNERYPSWLTRDWDSAKYGYREGDTGENLVDNENSPRELATYRAKYEQFILECKGQGDSSANALTRNSLLVENLSIAADDPICTLGVVSKVFDEVRAQVAPSITEEEGREFHLWEICVALGDGDLDAQRL
ncbi:MAG: hypothetical protein M4579_007287, partial [Chaenotheca gracillima]